MRTIIKTLLPKLARLHHKNGIERRQSYPQLWYCWPRFTNRKHKLLWAIRTGLCGLLTGHEISKTEWGYGGGKYADCNCRWCDKLIRVPIAETPPPNPVLETLAENLNTEQ